LLSSGTSTLVASVVPVPDLGTVDLMRRYHDALLLGHRPASALARAQAATDVDDPAALVASAGFVCMGAG
jgi:CHAT domain-containing protein